MRLISPHLTFPVIFWQLHSSFSRDLSHGRGPDGISEILLLKVITTACLFLTNLEKLMERQNSKTRYSTNVLFGQNILNFSISEPFPLPPSYGLHTCWSSKQVFGQKTICWWSSNRALSVSVTFIVMWRPFDPLIWLYSPVSQCLTVSFIWRCAFMLQ